LPPQQGPPPRRPADAACHTGRNMDRTPFVEGAVGFRSPFMTDTGTASSPGLFARALGVILSPGSTFRAVAVHPRPAGVLFLACLALASAAAVPFMSESGQRAMAEMQIEQMERFTGQPVPAEQRAAMQQNMGMGGVFGAAGIFIVVPVIVLIMTALFW